MNTSGIFDQYAALVATADRAFSKMQKEHGAAIQCRPHCSDCCHAVFGLFLIEAAHLKAHFDRLGRKKRRAALLRANKADRDLMQLQNRFRASDENLPQARDLLSKERIRCPLLDDQDLCILYPHRPITCRVYGIPTAIGG